VLCPAVLPLAEPTFAQLSTTTHNALPFRLMATLFAARYPLFTARYRV
jgi:hypothetical protein